MEIVLPVPFQGPLLSLIHKTSDHQRNDDLHTAPPGRKAVGEANLF